MNELLENKVNEVYEQVVSDRHYLHANPEVSFEEYNTSKYIFDIMKTLEKFEVEQLTPTSVVAILNADKGGKMIALRADIDALALTEEADVDYKSLNDGVMHACGHDMHASSLLGVARILNDIADQIPGRVKLIFQHAEETPPGGAIELIEKGVLDEVDQIFALHVFPDYELGSVYTKQGVMFASSDTFAVKINGKGGHGALPHLAIDPVVIMAQTIMALQTIVSRRSNLLHPPVISTTIVNGGSARNVIPDSVTMEGTVRNLDGETRLKTIELFKQIIEDTVKTNGGSAIVDYFEGYPVGKNEINSYNMQRKALARFLDDGMLKELEAPFTGSEDFSRYLEKVDGNMCVVGMRTTDNFVSVHNPKFVGNDQALAIAMKVHLYTVTEFFDLNK